MVIGLNILAAHVAEAKEVPPDIQESLSAIEVQLLERTSIPLSIEDQVRLAFPDAPIMVEIARAESGFNPKAKNPTSSASGVFQITAGTFADCTGDVFDVHDNIRCARMLYDTRGLQPWDASKIYWSQ